LIACDDDSVVEQLRINFRAANFNFESTKSFRAACRYVDSSWFDVVFTAPLLCDGAWQQLLEFARSRDSGLPFVVMARAFDIRDWDESMKSGAFDVLDIVEEMPRAAEVARQAYSTAILSVAPFSSLRPNLQEHHDLSRFADHDVPPQPREKENRT
jgi:DNA-binding NtrC family response regulator